MCLSFTVTAFEEILEDGHDGDEALHFEKAAAELGLTRSRTRQTRLRLGKANPEVVDDGEGGGGRIVDVASR